MATGAARSGHELKTVRQARSEYFSRNGLGDGGYESSWVRMQAGPVPIFFPNTAARVAAVRLHDIHHIVTGFDTTWTGEAQIAAWEIGGGCAHHLAAWILNLQAIAIGLFLSPRRVLDAFAVGRRSTNLYRLGIEEAQVDAPVSDLRHQFGVDREPPRPGPTDVLFFTAWATLGLLVLASSAFVTLGPVAWLLLRIIELFRP